MQMAENQNLESLVGSLEAANLQSDSGSTVELRLQLEILKELRRAYLLHDTIQSEVVEELRKLGKQVNELRGAIEATSRGGAVETSSKEETKASASSAGETAFTALRSSSPAESVTIDPSILSELRAIRQTQESFLNEFRSFLEVLERILRYEAVKGRL